MSTYVSCVSRYQATVRHLAGSANVPSDFAIRNAATCDGPEWLICSFTRQLKECVVQRLCTRDVINGDANPLFHQQSWVVINPERMLTWYRGLDRPRN